MRTLESMTCTKSQSAQEWVTDNKVEEYNNAEEQATKRQFIAKSMELLHDTHD
jgi:hypothetical protein